MSHYLVMVICRKGAGDDVESLLAPYDENLEVAPYVRYTKAQLIAEEIERINAARRSHQAALAAESEEAYLELVRNSDERYFNNYSYAKNDIPEKILTVDVNDEEAVYGLLREEREDETFDEDGNRISTYNPNSKWDWYEIGGRWGGSLKLKDGGSTDEDYAGQIDWDKMSSLEPERKKRASEFWDEYVLQKLPTEMLDRTVEEVDKYLNDKFGFIFYKREYYLECYKDKEEYLRRLATWTTYAVLDEKGWHAPGEMGWFGCSNETPDAQRDWEENFRSRFIDTLDPEDVVTVVDCHI